MPVFLGLPPRKAIIEGDEPGGPKPADIDEVKPLVDADVAAMHEADSSKAAAKMTDADFAEKFDKALKTAGLEMLPDDEDAVVFTELAAAVSDDAPDELAHPGSLIKTNSRLGHWSS